eukprot:scaffold5781_cov124-Isochrysis_galbana.AAC.9
MRCPCHCLLNQVALHHVLALQRRVDRHSLEHGSRLGSSELLRLDRKLRLGPQHVPTPTVLLAAAPTVAHTLGGEAPAPVSGVARGAKT